MSSVQAVSAQLYYQNSSLQQDHANEVLTMFRVPSGGLVLDLGCGTGYLATVLSDLVGPKGKVVAVDPDDERVKVARQKNPRSNIEYLVADDTSFPGEGYDLIVSTHVIHWIKNKDALFTRISNKLAPYGSFAFVTYDGTPTPAPTVSKALSDLVSPNFEHDIHFKLMNFLTLHQYEILASNTGLHVTSAKTILKQLRYNDTEECLNFWAGVSHGGFDVAAVDKEALQYFKQNFESDLANEVSPLNTLFMVLRR